MKTIRILVSKNGEFTDFLGPVEATIEIARSIDPKVTDRRQALDWTVKEVHKRVEYRTDLERTKELEQEIKEMEAERDALHPGDPNISHLTTILIGLMAGLKRRAESPEEEFSGPEKTLKDGVGDCEDMAFTAGSLANALPEAVRPDMVRVTIGIVKPFLFPLVQPTSYHAWTEARSGNKWYILEVTSGELLEAPDWRYGPIISIYPNRIEFH